MIETISKILATDRTNSKPIVLKELENGCVVCTSHKPQDTGYLLLCRSGGSVLAHRLVYEYFHGPIPEGIKVCHHCDYPPCLNPDHFFAGTHANNMKDMAKKGRGTIGNTWNRGEKQGSVKLTDEKVLEIRRKWETGQYTQAALARESVVGQAQIGRIVRNERWKHLNNSTQVFEQRR